MITYERLSKIIPPDQALACKALSVSLQQIKNIADLQLLQLALAYTITETTKDLDQISALTVAVPPSVAAFYAADYATGSGSDGTLVLTDLLGAAVGIPYITNIDNCVTTINSLTTSGELANLINIYTRMENTVNGVYGNAITGPVTIPPGFAAGIYASAEEAFSNALISAATVEIGNVVIQNPTETTSLNTEFNSMATSVIAENTNQQLASIDIANLTTVDRAAVMSFVQTLPGYGLDTEENGPVWILEQVADLNTIGGQAIIGCLREGRNIAILNSVGIGQDTAIPSDPAVVPPPAVLLPSTYNEAEATNLVVK